MNQVHRDDAFAIDLLPDLVRNYEGWEQRHFVPEVGLFWQTGHDDGMEFNINSRQTRTSCAGLRAIDRHSMLTCGPMPLRLPSSLDWQGRGDLAERVSRRKPSRSKQRCCNCCGTTSENSSFPVYKNDEERDGHRIKALTKTYEDGQFAGDPHGARVDRLCAVAVQHA